MDVEPDAHEAVDDRARLLERLRAVLDRAELPSPPGDGLRHPAAVETVHTVQRALRSGPLSPELRRTLAARLDHLPPPVFGPAEPQDHLSRSVARALRSIPARAGADGTPVTADVVRWRGSEREALAQSLGLLARVWPEAAAEVRESVAEVALLTGDAIDGYTDFTVHGAVLVHRARLTASAAGLPGPVRFAEALVHEGAHTRCNAAALAEPFLLPDRPAGPDTPGRRTELLVATPLRADPRPLTGLFQQTVVLARSVLLYRRFTGPGPAVDARHQDLLASAHQAVTTLTAHTDTLTPHGRRLLAQCAAVLGGPA
ncbi:aKG-HExxH-type peptide beta-hydroxylase [Kitasatospora sp. NPDC086801]|uniref:aKG-HExxH-type peptide beta-hydroxylase n=1 Tax=Kitasatospora sp. NPDC086801 TaxID=3364066 RepID=UPI00382F47AF